MFQCVKCQKTFKLKSILNRHYNRKTPCDQKIIHKCYNCLKEFPNKTDLTRHNNRKFPCKKVDPIIENYELKLENAELRHAKTINNITNNNNQQNIYNITINAGEKYYKNHMLHQICDEFNIDETMINNLILAKGFDFNNDLNNVGVFTELIVKICFNLQQPENWRFIYDKIAELLKIKINDKIVNFPEYFLEFIYILYKQVVNCKTLDPEIISFYQKYIENYENNKYANHDSTSFIKLCYDQIIAQYMGVIKLIDQKLKINEVIDLPITPIIEFKLNYFKHEDLTVLDRDMPEYVVGIRNRNCNINCFGSNFTFKYRGLKCVYNDLPKYEVFCYLFTLIYQSKKENRTIKYEEDSYMIYYKEDDWREIQLVDLIKAIFIKIHEVVEYTNADLSTVLVDEYQIKYYEADSDDEDYDESDSKRVNYSHLKKYNNMMRYLLTDDKFVSIGEFPIW